MVSININSFIDKDINFKNHLNYYEQYICVVSGFISKLLYVIRSPFWDRFFDGMILLQNQEVVPLNWDLFGFPSNIILWKFEGSNGFFVNLNKFEISSLENWGQLQ